MKCLWSIFLVAVLLVDWLDCSPPSKDPGTRRRKNKLRAEGSSTTSTQTLELHDLLNVSTTPTTAASARSSSQEKPDVTKNEKAGPHPIEETNVESKIEVILFSNNITKVEDNDDRRLDSTDLSRGTSNFSSQGRPSENDKKETKGRETITLSSPLSTTSSSLSSDNIITTRRNDSAITTYTSTASTTPTVITSTLPSKANVTGNLTGFTQRCTSDQGGSCIPSTVTSSSSSSSSAATASTSSAAAAAESTLTIADSASPNSHPASSSSQTTSGLTQQPASSSWGDQAAEAGVAAVGGPSVQARTAPCTPCDVRQCQPVFPESCDGLIRKDVCGCCPICSSFEDAGTGMEMMVTTSLGVGGVGVNAGVNVCDSIRCPRGRVCLLNIQGLPMCRCPSVFHCRRLPDRPICSTDGRTFKNRCFVSVEECVSSRTLSIAHDGRCEDEVMGMMVVTTHASASSANRSQPHQTQFLMSDERVRHQGYRARNNRQRQHRRQKQTRGRELHERQPQHTDGAAVTAAGDKRRPDAPQAKRKSSQGQRD